jgi:hypothetical protein
MKLIQQLTEHANITQAKQLNLYKATFPNGFLRFMEELATVGLVRPDYRRTVVDGKHVWTNDLLRGGLLVETTEHPHLNKQCVGTLTITGPRDAIKIIETLIASQAVLHEGAAVTQAPQITHEYHDELNPALWDADGTNYQLKEDVRDALLEIAEEFKAFHKLSVLDVIDITLTGSCANYHWTPESDIDLHLLVDINKVKKQYGPLVPEYFEAKRKVWSDLHDITIHGIPVEPYMQNIHERHHATAIYSLTKNDWITPPSHNKPTIDDAAVKAKLKRLMSEIDDVVASCNKASSVEALMSKIKQMRTIGLESGGEFATENLVFKELRRNGYFEKLADCKTRAYDRELSIEDEEWDSLS